MIGPARGRPDRTEGHMSAAMSSPLSPGKRAFAVAQALAEISLYLRGVSASLQKGLDPEVLAAYSGQIEGVTQRLTALRNHMWLLQYDAQVSRESAAAPSDDPGQDTKPPRAGEPA